MAVGQDRDSGTLGLGSGPATGTQVTVTSQSPTLRSQPCPQRCSCARHAGLPAFLLDPENCPARGRTPQIRLFALGPVVSVRRPTCCLPSVPSPSAFLCLRFLSVSLPRPLVSPKTSAGAGAPATGLAQMGGQTDGNWDGLGAGSHCLVSLCAGPCPGPGHIP